MTVIKDKRILVTGPAGNIGYPLARYLAKDNEVWGIARFSNPADRKMVDDLGVITRSIDLADGEYGDLPDNFDYVLHLSMYYIGEDFERSMRVNAEGTALLMTHCRKAKAILVMSTIGVSRPVDDPWHVYKETDPCGGFNSPPGSPYYAISKVVQEGVARACARQMNIRTVLPRMNAAYGETGSGGFPGWNFDAIRAGKEVVVYSNPTPYSPIHYRDICDQVEAMLDVASTPATIINWGGDEVVSSHQWCGYFGEFLGVTPKVTVQNVPGTRKGAIADNAKRMALTGPCKVKWQDGMRELAEAHMARG